MNYVNLTPHSVTVLDQGGGHLATFPSAGEARLATSRVIAGRAGVQREGKFDTSFVPVFATSFGELTGLPSEPVPDTLYIVSTKVAEYAAIRPRFDRWPLVVPDMVVRNEAGDIIGCQGFAFMCGYVIARAWGVLLQMPGDVWASAIGPEAGKVILSARDAR